MWNARLIGCWPGLPGAWYRGHSQGLFFSVLFAWALCFLLLATLVWTEWVPHLLLTALWISIGIGWLATTVRTQWSLANLFDSTPNASDFEGQFAAAQQEYLKGKWYDAEARLLNLTLEQPDNMAAGLLLVGVLRRTGRSKPALRRLEQLLLLDASAGWHFELAREKRLLESNQD